MPRYACCLAALVIIALLLASGCGRPSLPGRQFQGERATVPRTVATDTPLPEKPIVEWGQAEAKVRIVAFFANDKYHQKLMDLLKEAATQKYPGKVYVKYVDYRTPEGRAAFARANLQVSTVMINGQSSVDLPGPAGPRTVDFVQEMGRYWTADDLEEAIGHTVAKVYGKSAAKGK